MPRFADFVVLCAAESKGRFWRDRHLRRHVLFFVQWICLGHIHAYPFEKRYGIADVIDSQYESYKKIHVIHRGHELTVPEVALTIRLI